MLAKQTNHDTLVLEVWVAERLICPHWKMQIFSKNILKYRSILF